MNEILAYVFLFLSTYLRTHLKTQEQSTSFTQIFFIESINIGVIALFLGFDIIGLNKFFFADDPTYDRQVFKGFSDDWFMVIG